MYLRPGLTGRNDHDHAAGCDCRAYNDSQALYQSSAGEMPDTANHISLCAEEGQCRSDERHDRYDEEDDTALSEQRRFSPAATIEAIWTHRHCESILEREVRCWTNDVFSYMQSDQKSSTDDHAIDNELDPCKEVTLEGWKPKSVNSWLGQSQHRPPR